MSKRKKSFDFWAELGKCDHCEEEDWVAPVHMSDPVILPFVEATLHLCWKCFTKKGGVS